MQFESSVEINASPENIFNIYSQVHQWPIWDTDTNFAVLNGDFSANTILICKLNLVLVSKLGY